MADQSASTGPVVGSVDTGRHARLRRRLGFAAVVACLPYLGLKLLWVCCVDVGVIDRSGLSTAAWIAVNLVTFLMDAAAEVIAYWLTRPGGPRVRTWLVALPMWTASGLLSAIMLAVPFQLVVGLLGSANPSAGDDFLQPWVYGVVYGGFIVEGAALLGAFAIYVHDRHGSVVNAPVRAFTRRVPPAARTAAAVAAGLLAATALARFAWACGAEFGLTAARISDMDSGARVVQATQAALSSAAAGGLAVLARGRSGYRVRLPLAAAWVGSASACSWGGFLGLIGDLVGADHRGSPFMAAVYGAEAVAGLLVLGAGTRALAGKPPRGAAPTDHVTTH
ncbi:hypothetical protein [Streptomyces palmae]|uniref:Uncharacterized protein n=1 Tax=Streptomyces palmae TaxID=1701085 RepID=A0A4Z0H6X6_9ACTN|nr:hypothetical protein [Streptomyces palmae]TGB09174.1 hypothetical protein E4099_14170 [Streptomyces palmae]